MGDFGCEVQEQDVWVGVKLQVVGEEQNTNNVKTPTKYLNNCAYRSLHL